MLLHYYDLCFTFYQQVGRLQQKVDEMEMTQRDLVAEYEEHVMHLKEEVYQDWAVILWFMIKMLYLMNQPQYYFPLSIPLKIIEIM